MKTMKKTFSTPEMEVIRFVEEDVVRCSGCLGDGSVFCCTSFGCGNSYWWGQGCTSYRFCYY